MSVPPKFGSIGDFHETEIITEHGWNRLQP